MKLIYIYLLLSLRKSSTCVPSPAPATANSIQLVAQNIVEYNGPGRFSVTKTGSVKFYTNNYIVILSMQIK